MYRWLKFSASFCRQPNTFDVLVRPFKVTVYFIIPTLYCIVSSMTPMVTAPEDNRNSFIPKVAKL
jgi:hypothetical protein